MNPSTQRRLAYFGLILGLASQVAVAIAGMALGKPHMIVVAGTTVAALASITIAIESWYRSARAAQR